MAVTGLLTGDVPQGLVRAVRIGCHRQDIVGCEGASGPDGEANEGGVRRLDVREFLVEAAVERVSVPVTFTKDVDRGTHYSSQLAVSPPPVSLRIA